MKEERLKEAVPLLVAWYRCHRRELPWRKGEGPYPVWISEIMLQQTRIEAAIPYYERFMSELPDVKALAEVPEERLLKLWEGLGYYSRARNLKKAAETIMENGGTMPQKAEELRKLPGIGDYTAGAISSIAFGEPSPAVDGNVLRVIMRLWNREDDVLSAKTKKTVFEALSEVYPTGEEAALLTEGLMELGEVVCVPNGEPKCELCSLRELCEARKKGTAILLPKRKEKAPRRQEQKTVFLLRCGERYALHRREDKGLLAGLWEFPNEDGCFSEEEAKEWLSGLGFSVRSVEPCGEAKHGFSHVEWKMTGYWVEVEKEAVFVWKTAEEVQNSVALPSAFAFFEKQISG